MFSVSACPEPAGRAEDLQHSIFSVASEAAATQPLEHTAFPRRLLGYRNIHQKNNTLNDEARWTLGPSRRGGLAQHRV